jgi:Leucine-rich repeat (LRR) protein
MMIFLVFALALLFRINTTGALLQVSDCWTSITCSPGSGPCYELSNKTLQCFQVGLLPIDARFLSISFPSSYIINFPDALKSLTVLEEISFWCPYTDPNTKLFNGLSKLKKLRIGSYSFSEFTENVFAGLTSLKYLDLSYQDFETLPVGVFRDLSSLEFLQFSGSQKLKSLPKRIFAPLVNLKKLGFSFTSRSSSYYFDDLLSGLSALETLSLTQCNTASFPENLFEDLTSLKALDLYANELTSLPENLFKNLSSLQTLDLSDNPIAVLPKRLFRNLISLQVLYMNLNDSFIEKLPLDTFCGLPKLTALYLIRQHMNMWSEVLITL